MISMGDVCVLGQEMGPWCAAAAFLGMLECTSQRNMYSSTRAPRAGSDLLGIADAPAMSQADAWCRPTHSRIPCRLPLYVFLLLFGAIDV